MSESLDESKVRSAEQIEHDLQRTREEMIATVNELANRLDPKTLAKDAAEQARDKVTTAAQTAQEKAQNALHAASEALSDIRERAEHTVEKAKAGDRKALTTLGSVALAGLCAFTLLLHRKK